MDIEDWDIYGRKREDYIKYCLGARSAPFPPSALRLGTTIPQEVLWNVIDSLRMAKDTVAGSKMKKFVETGHNSQKRYLTTLSLTCRDWATVVRPRLFHHLQLKTPLDVDQLLDFLASPVSVGPPLSTCIRNVLYRMDQEQIPPWIHLHDLSRIIPKATMTLMVYDVPGQSLLKIFPRSLPPSIFPFHEIKLQKLKFQRTNEFIPLFNHNVDESCLSEIDVENGDTRMPMPRAALRRLQSRPTCYFGVPKIGADAESFSSQFKLVCAVLHPADRMGWDRMTWSSAADAITALAPLDYNVEELSVVRSKQSPHDPPHITIMAGPKLLMDMRLFTLPLKSGHRWTMSVSIAHHGDISTFDQTTFAAWNEVADNFLQATQHGSLHVKIDYDHDGLLDAILEGRILEKVATEGRLLLRRYNPIYDNDDQEEDHSDFNGMKAVTKDEILSTPLNRVVGDCTIELTPIERFWLLTHKVTEEECLEALIRKRESRAEQEAKEKEEERQKEEGWKAWQEVMQELLRKAEAKAEEEELGKVYPSGGEAQAESANSGDRSDVTMVDAKQTPTNTRVDDQEGGMSTIPQPGKGTVCLQQPLTDDSLISEETSSIRELLPKTSTSDFEDEKLDAQRGESAADILLGERIKD